MRYSVEDGLAGARPLQFEKTVGPGDRAILLDLEDPARGDPGPRADRVEPEIDVGLRMLC